MVRGRRVFGFQIVRGSLGEVLADRGLASLGDAYVNFVYSLALSSGRGRPLGVRVKGSVLAEGLRSAGLRDCLGSGMTRHRLADAAEALIVYAWLSNSISLDESVEILWKNTDAVEGLSRLLIAAKERITFP